MNKVLLTGHLVKDVVIKSSGQTSYALGTIAVKRNYKNSEGKYESDFISFIANGKVVDYLDKYTHKGDKIEIVGEWHVRQITEPSGVVQYRNECKVEDVALLQSKPKEEEFKYKDVDFKKAEEKGELPF